MWAQGLCRCLGGGVAIRRKIGKREPARGEKQEGTIAIDGGGTDAGDGTVLLVGERAGVGERDRDFATRRHGSGQVDDEVEGILRVAFKGERFSFGRFHVGDVEIGVQLDADGAGDVVGFEVDPCDGGEGLRDGIEGGGDVVMLGEKGGRARGLSPGGRGDAAKEQSYEKGCGFQFLAAGHRTPFVLIGVHDVVDISGRLASR